MRKIAIVNTTIIDGSQRPSYKGSVVVDGRRIEKIIVDGEIDEGVEEVLTIDGSQYVLTPGFIDTHSHSDLEVLEKDIIEPKIRQGVTTEVLGQDGIAMAPLPLKYIDDWRKNIGGLEGESETIDWTYKTIEGYLDAIKLKQPSSNMAYLIPHGNVRMAAMGLDNRSATSNELEAMKTMVREGMEKGCFGLSSGLIYIPCAYSHEEELIELCKVVAAFDGLFVVHQRSEANTILESMDEIIRIGLASGVKIHFSHFKLCGVNNYHLLNDVLKKLDEAKAKGLNVSFDQYPYRAGSTMLGVILPPWVHDGGTEKMLTRLKNEEIRNKLKAQMYEHNSDWDNFIEFAGVEGIYITSVSSESNKGLIGKNLKQIGELREKDPLDAAFDLLIEENNGVGIIDFYGHEDHIKTFLLREEMNVCTDGLLSGTPHPRVYGSFPKIISKYVRDEKILTIEQAIYKMTAKPATLLGLKDRGIIKQGAFADLLLFDKNQFEYFGSYVNPRQFPIGLKLVMVNGHILFDGQNYDVQPCGEVLTKA